MENNLPTKTKVKESATKLISSGSFELDFDDAAIMATLQATVARNTTKEEYWIFAQYCRSTRLNPLKNEVWCIKTPGYTGKDGTWHDGKLQIMTGINGFLAIANSNPQFDGLKVTVDRPGGRGAPRAATATVWRKDRAHPHEVTVYFEEYYRPNFSGKQGNWDKMPCTMLEKVAKARALREAFPQELGGINTEDEMPAEYALVEDQTPGASPPSAPQLPEGQVRYVIPNIQREQEIYLEKRGFAQDVDGAWFGPNDLGERLEKYRVSVGKSSDAGPIAENNSNGQGA